MPKNIPKVVIVENRIKNLENAANDDAFDKSKVFEIYKQIPFDLNSLINAEKIYQSLEGTDSRDLIYQKLLLSDNVENKIKLLIILKDLLNLKLYYYYLS